MKTDEKQERHKESLIGKLLELGFFKKGELQLFELSLEDLEEEYKKRHTAKD